MIGICFLTCLTFFPASCHLIGDVGPPPELMAGDTGEGNEGYLFGDVKKCELQSENLAVEREFNVYLVTFNLLLCYTLMLYFSIFNNIHL